MKNKKTIELPIEWITELQHYIDKVCDTTKNEAENKRAVIALLGYLSSLEFFKMLNK